MVVKGEFRLHVYGGIETSGIDLNQIVLESFF